MSQDEVRLEDESAHLHRALNQTLTSIMMVDEGFVITYVNDSARRLFKKHEAALRVGWSDFDAEQLVGTSIDRFYPDLEERWLLLVEPANLPFQTDLRMGEVVFKLQISGHFDEGGALVGHILEWVDVTVRRRRESEAVLLSRAVEHAQTAIMMVDSDSKISYVNESTRRMLDRHAEAFQKGWPGFSAETILGRPIDVWYRQPESLRKTLADPANLPHQMDIQVAGLAFTVHVSGQLGPQGELLGHTLEWFDVTARRAQEAEAARLLAAIDQAQTAMMMVDRDFVITYVNGSTRQLLAQHEAAFRRVWPDFTADSIVGRCVDAFHTKPQHQREMLSNPQNLPFRTDIHIDNLVFTLQVSAQLGAEGELVGHTLEWFDATELKQKEAEARRLSRAIEQAQTSMLMMGRDFVITYVNDSARELFREHEATFRALWPDFSPDTLVGRCVDDFHKKPGHQRALLSKPDNLPYRTDIQIADLLFKLQVSGQFNPDGELRGYTLELADVTAARQQQAEARRLLRAIEQAQTSMLMVNRDYQITYMNESTRRLFRKHEATFRTVWPDFSTDEVVGRCIDDFHRHPEHQRAILADPDNLPYRTDIRIADLVFSLQVSGQFNDSGELRGHTLEMVDVTEQRAAEKLNAEFKGRFNAVDATMAVISFELDGTILDANDNFLRAMGYELAEIQGHHHRMFLSPGDTQSAEEDELWAKLRGGQMHKAVIGRIGKGGREVWLQAVYAPLFDDSGQPFRVMKFATDTTATIQERRRIDEGVVEILDVVEDASKGRLNRTVGLSGTDAMGRVGCGLNMLFESLRGGLQHVGDSTTQVLSSSGELDRLSASMLDSAREADRETAKARAMTDEVDAHVADVSVATKELGISVSEIAASATNAATVAKSAVDSAQAAHETISRLGEASTQIGSVIRVINSVADQTKLLALNATIEAARAGEAGRGFAVVANEVKELAKETADATQNIGTQVDGIQASVDETVVAIQRILETIENINEYQSAIASAVEEQSATTKEISRSIEEVVDRTKGIVGAMASVGERVKNAAEGSNDTRTSAAALATTASGLQEVMARFDISN